MLNDWDSGKAETRKRYFPEWDICHNGEAHANETEGNKKKRNGFRFIGLRAIDLELII
jgi:hypothetical protein